jgi:site-specific DNA-methyltransferase (cytosine-N4-specific)
MEALLKKGKYNSGERPSEHRISEKGFLKKHRGSIMHNLIELEPIDCGRDPRLPGNVLSIANTNSNGYFLQKCREKEMQPHPARMQIGLVNFFINFLTGKNDLILDPFAGSNTTGFCAERLSRRWISIETEKEYAKQSKVRFSDPLLKK